VVTIAVGFLLTASATWTGVNPLQGRPLAALCVLWLVARIGFLVPNPVGFAVAAASDVAFLVASAAALGRVIYRSKGRRNDVLPLLLLGLAVADGLYLEAAMRGDFVLLLRRFDAGLLCMAVIALLVARRVIPFFAMRAVAGLQIPMHELGAKVQLGAGVLAVAFSLAQWRVPLALALMLIAGLCAVQLASWKPWAVRRLPLVWVLYLGYAGLGAGLLLSALHALGVVQGPALHIHVIAIGGFSVLIIGMVTRTALGHLSRPLVLDGRMRLCYHLVIAAFVLRLLALLPSGPGLLALQCAAVAWGCAFVLYIVRFLPMMIRANARPSATIPLQPRRAT
jgi:uncharacterized protein involved in response to NO